MSLSNFQTCPSKLTLILQELLFLTSITRQFLSNLFVLFQQFITKKALYVCFFIINGRLSNTNNSWEEPK